MNLLEMTHYLPILTTVISAVFATAILSRYRSKSKAYHLLWWGLGVLLFGVGTLIESLTTLFGWHPFLFRTWYIAGALLGGAPLALGTVYLLWGRPLGNVAAALLISTVSIISVLVFLSPLHIDLADPHVLNSDVLAWQDIRLVSPFINGTAALVLIGGAIYSSVIAFTKRGNKYHGIGNVLIAVGAILPGVGGMMSRMGHTEGLYVGELIGIILIWIGYRTCQRQQPVTELSANAQGVEAT